MLGLHLVQAGTLPHQLRGLIYLACVLCIVDWHHHRVQQAITASLQGIAAVVLSLLHVCMLPQHPHNWMLSSWDVILMCVRC